MRLPDFIVVGARKCGTTWLDECLRQHPGIFMPEETKELYFFDRYWDRGVEWYAGHFAECPPGRICGEGTPSYLTETQAPARIKAVLPDAKLVFIFRDPIERLVSAYHHLLAKGDTALPLAQAIDAFPDLIDEGFYARHLAHFRDVFGADATIGLLLEDNRLKGEVVLEPLFAFLGVDPAFRPPALWAPVNERREARSRFLGLLASRVSRLLHAMGLHRVVNFIKAAGAGNLVFQAAKKAPEPVPADIIARLRKLYVPDVRRLEVMLGRDLSGVWRTTMAEAIVNA